MMNSIIPVTHARRNLLKLVDKVYGEYIQIDFTKNGKVKASSVSPEYLDSLEATIYSLKHSFKDIRQAEKEVKERKYISLEELLNELNAR